MMIQKRHTLSGFTLTEVLVAISITAIVLVLFNRILIDGYRVLVSLSTSRAATERIALIEKNIAKELDHCMSSAQGAFPIDTALPNELAFYSRISPTDPITFIQYNQTNTELTRSTTTPSGTPPVYPSIPSFSETILEAAPSSPSLFIYMDENGKQLSTPVNTAAIRSIYFSIRSGPSTILVPTCLIR